MVREHSLYFLNPYKCIDVYIMNQYMVYHCKSMDTGKECVFCNLGVMSSINDNWILFVDGLIQFFYIFANFLSSTTIKCEILKSPNYYYRFVYFLFPLHLSQVFFFFMYFKVLLFCIWHRSTTPFWWCECIIIMYCTSLSLVITLAI